MYQLSNFSFMWFHSKEMFKCLFFGLLSTTIMKCSQPVWFNTAVQLIITGVDMKRDVFPTNYMAKGYQGKMHMKAPPFSYLFTSPLPSSLFPCLLPHLIKMPSSVYWRAPSLLLSVLCCSVNTLCHIRSLNPLCHHLEAKRLIRHVWQFDCAMLDGTMTGILNVICLGMPGPLLPAWNWSEVWGGSC